MNKRSGLTFETGNARDLAKQIIWAIQNPVELKKLAENGFNWQKDKFLIEDMARKHMEFYKTLL